MKKAIILLTTLFFIAMISVLIVDNMKSADVFLKETNSDLVNAQAIISVNNYKNEIGKLLIKYKKDLDASLPLEVPLNINEITSIINVKRYEGMYNINNIISENVSEKNKLERFFIDSDVDYDAFSYFFKHYMDTLPGITRVDSFKQVNKIIEEYKNSTDNRDIEKIENVLGFITVTAQSNLIICSLEFDIYGKSVGSQFIYNLNEINENNIEVKDFEITFK